MGADLPDRGRLSRLGPSGENRFPAVSSPHRLGGGPYRPERGSARWTNFRRM